MAYIESHQELAHHPKAKRLARLLGASLPCVIGHLHLLWWWALDYAPDGQLARFEDDVLADGCMWEGDPATLVAALHTAGFINADGTIHDWYDYAGKLVQRRQEDAARKRSIRRPPPSTAVSTDVRRTTAAPGADLQRTSDGHPEDGDGCPEDGVSRSAQLSGDNTTQHNTKAAQRSAPIAADADMHMVYRAVVGRGASIQELRAWQAVRAQFTPEEAQTALEMAVERSAGSPAAYALRILRDDQEEGDRGRNGATSAGGRDPGPSRAAVRAASELAQFRRYATPADEVDRLLNLSRPGLRVPGDAEAVCGPLSSGP